MTEGRTGLRLKVFAALVAFMFAALTTRLWFLQVLAADQFRDIARQNAVLVAQIESVECETERRAPHGHPRAARTDPR